MSLRRFLVWVAAAVLLMAAAMLWRRTSRPQTAGPMPSPVEAAEPAVTDQSSDTRALVTRIADEAAAGEPPAPRQAEEDEGYGSLIGYLFDIDGSVRDGEFVGLSPNPPDPLAPPSMPHSTRTNVDGYFEFEHLTAGTWDVHLNLDRTGKGSVLLGSVVVRADHAERHDFVVPGERSFAGSLLCKDHPTAILWLELRFANAPDRIAARGTTSPPLVERNEPKPTPERRWTDDVGDDDAERAPRAKPVPGHFRFEHLSAEAYVLRIQIGTDEEGRGIYLEREVDLTLGDVALEPEEIEAAEFLLATMERRGDL